MSRRKTTPDADVLAAAGRVINRISPARLTLAEVRQGMAGVDECSARLRSAHRSPLAALGASLIEVSRLSESPEALANNLAFLEIDLKDPGFHHLAIENSRSLLRGLPRAAR